jgi:hypothetical protein
LLLLELDPTEMSPMITAPSFSVKLLPEPGIDCDLSLFGDVSPLQGARFELGASEQRLV